MNEFRFPIDVLSSSYESRYEHWAGGSVYRSDMGEAAGKKWVRTMTALDMSAPMFLWLFEQDIEFSHHVETPDFFHVTMVIGIEDGASAALFKMRFG